MNGLLLSLVFAGCFTMATILAPHFDALQSRRGPAAGPLLALVGEGRELFANQFFAMADVYYHSGYYPTIFDARKREANRNLDVASREPDTPGKEPDEDDNFMGKPRDWIEKFGRNFIPTVHTHLKSGNAREILPWLKLSAEMDPKQIQAYLTASYWLRSQLHQPDEAEQFLRQGLRANPDSYELMLELGRVYFYDKGNARVARNIWDRAVEEWRHQDEAKESPDPGIEEEILGELVRDDQRSGNLQQLLPDLQMLRSVSPSKGVLEQEIQETKAKLEAMKQ